MFRRAKQFVKSNEVSPDKFIDGEDIWNSELMYLLDQETDLKEYYVTKYEKRIDLISVDIYGEERYSWILLHLNRINLEDIVRGINIKYIPINRLREIISWL
jgi:hypothetical protein